MRNIFKIIDQKHYRKLLVVCSLLMYVGSAHGMMFLMNVSKDTGQQHAMHSKSHIVHDTITKMNSDSHEMHSSMSIVDNETSIQGHDMQSCLDHCLTSMAISIELPSFASSYYREMLMTSLDVDFYSLQAEIALPPPKIKLI